MAACPSPHALEADVVEWDGGLKTLSTSVDYVKRHHHLYEPTGTWAHHDKVLAREPKREYLNRTYPEEPEYVSYYIPRQEDWDSNLKTLEGERPASRRTLTGTLTNWDKLCEQPRRTKDIDPQDSWNNHNFKVMNKSRRHLVVETDSWNSNIKSLYNHGKDMLPRTEVDRRRPLHHEDEWTDARKTLSEGERRKPSKCSAFGDKLEHHEIAINSWETDNRKTIAETRRGYFNREPPGGKPKATGKKRYTNTWMNENFKVLESSKPAGKSNDWSGTAKVLEKESSPRRAGNRDMGDSWLAGNKVVPEPYDRYKNYSVTNKVRDFHQGTATAILPGAVPNE